MRGITAARGRPRSQYVTVQTEASGVMIPADRTSVLRRTASSSCSGRAAPTVRPPSHRRLVCIWAPRRPWWPLGLRVASGHGLDEDVGDFRPAELRRRALPRPEHLPDLGPREDQAVLVA